MKKQLLTFAFLTFGLMLKAQSPYPIIPIDSVQFVNQAKLETPSENTFPDWITPYFHDSTYRDTVRFEGVVISNPKTYGLSTSRKAAYIQRIGGGPWSGVLVMCDPAGITPAITLNDLKTETKFYDNFVPGKYVRVTGVIRNFQGETQVSLVRDNPEYSNAVQQLSFNDTTITWTEIPANELMSGNPNTGWVQQKHKAERWEGTPVVIKDVTVYSVSTFGSGGTRSDWSVIDDYGNVISIRDMSSHLRRDGFGDSTGLNANDPSRFTPPPVGTRLEFIRGIVTEYSVSGVQRYGIAPLYQTDYKICTSCPPSIKYIDRSPLVATVNDTLAFTFEITTGDTTLKSQYLYFKKPGSSTIDSVAMTSRPSYPNQFIGKVAAPFNAGVFTYWAHATDKKDRGTFFPDPLTLGRSIMITDNGVNNIRILQFSNATNGATIWDGDSLLNISVKGVITTNDKFGSVITMQDGQGVNSAIFVHSNSNYGTDTLLAGDSIEITSAKVRENYNVTTLYSVKYNFLKRGAEMPTMETTLSIDSFINNKIAYARPYEGVLMRFDSVKVISENPDGPSNDYQEFSVYPKDGSPALGLRVDDLSANFKGLNTIVKAGMIMGFIQGPMYYANGNFKLIPRNFGDIDLSGIDTIPPVITVLGNNPDTINKNQAYTDAGATAMDNKDGDITNKITVTGSVDSSTVGTYTLTYTVSDNWGNTATATRTVIVMDTIAIGIKQNTLAEATIHVYPNPATESITLNVSGTHSNNTNIAIYDVLGKVVYSKNINGNTIHEKLDVTALNNGVYFIKLSNEQGAKTIRIVVNK
ncbi:MAG: DUF5011 domain-containing protein [Bacteroidia bacterium]|nr:DUF5011 domain-containing protein [Bacteroidia bacterium]